MVDSSGLLTEGSSRLRIGDVLADRYRIESVLGEGGMGMVYAVVDIDTRTHLAMKVVTNSTDPEHIKRFSREGRATMRLDSDHVVRVFDVGSINGKLPYMVMERLEGTTLKALAEKKPLDERTVADFGIQACEGLAHAHAMGIVHRDVKPSNLFVMSGPEGEPRHLKVLDFGISRMASFEDWERTATVTESNALLGSPHYVSPEQLQNPSGVDDRADIWSLGVSMYYALSGKFPFAGNSLAELLVAVMSQAPVPITSRCAVSPQMSAILARCMERALDRRYRRVSDLAQALAPLASPARAALASRVSSILSSATALLPSAAQPAPAPAAEAGRIGEKTMTVNEPLVPLFQGAVVRPPGFSAPSSPYPMIEPEPTFASGLSGVAGAVLPNDSASLPHQGGGGGGTRWELALEPRAEDPSRGRPSWIVGVALGIGAAIVIATIGLAVTRARTAIVSTQPTTTPAASFPPVDPSFPIAPPTPTPPIDPASSVSPPTAASPNVDPSGAPQLELVADAPITKVIRPASRRVALEDGKAIVTVNPFHSDLLIEVEIAGGGRARGTAHASGPTTIHLVTMPGKVGKGAPSKTPASRPSASGSELHKSPYEE